MVEFEKIARTEEKARQFEKDLYELSRQLRLENRLVRVDISVPDFIGILHAGEHPRGSEFK